MQSMTYEAQSVNLDAPADLEPTGPTRSDSDWWTAETAGDDWQDEYRWALGAGDDDEPDSWFDDLYAERVADGWPTDEDCLPGRIG